MADTIRINFRVLYSRHPAATDAAALEEPAAFAVRKLQPIVAELSLETVRDESFIHGILSTIDDIINSDVPWTILSFVVTVLDFVACNTIAGSSSGDPVTTKLILYATVLLEREEPRLRLQVSDMLKSLSTAMYTEESVTNSDLFQSFIRHLGEKIVRDWTRCESTREALLGSDSRVQMDDTTGWNKLESYLQALQSVVLGISSHSPAAAVSFLHVHSVTAPPRLYSPNEAPAEATTIAALSAVTVNPALPLESSVEEAPSIDLSALLITEASLHINRHVRENTFKFIAQLFSRADSSLPEAAYLMYGASAMHGVTPSPPAALRTEKAVSSWMSTEGRLTTGRVHTALLTGLQGDWSQIRHAAALACQSFLQAISDSRVASSQSPDLLSCYLEGILPRLCMNRFYPAAAVQSVSQATWRSVLGPNALGRTLLAQHASAVVTYYCDMTRARNHMTSEAACQAIAEFTGRMEPAVVLPHVPLLLRTLCQCLHDDRWPVRDAAIIASGILVRYFAAESVVQQGLPELLRCWTENLKDFIWSVREHAAIAFGEALRCVEKSGQTHDGDMTPPSVQSVHLQVSKTALSYIRRNLFFALHGESRLIAEDGVDKEDEVKAAVSVAPKVKNFLPESLLRADAAAKRRQQQQIRPPLDSGLTSNASQVTEPTSSFQAAAVQDTARVREELTEPAQESKDKDRKGWGCCIDCIELRSCRPWEVTHGAVYLLREAVRASPGLLEELLTVPSADGSESEGTDGGGEIGGSVQIARVSLLDAVVSLLTCLTCKAPTVTEGAVDAGTTTRRVQSAASGVSTEPEEALLAAALYEEIPAILATAVDASATAASAAAIYPAAGVNMDGASASPSVKLTFGRDGLCLLKIISCIASTLRAGQLASASAALSTAPTRSVGGSSASISSVDAVARHSQHAARRSARNKDKLVVAAEKCLAALPSALTVAAQQDGAEDVARGEIGNTDLRKWHEELLAMFPEDLRVCVQNVL